MKRHVSPRLQWPQPRTVRAHGLPAWVRLAVAVAKADDDGRPLPCQHDRDLHYDDDRTEQAIDACLRCPVIALCDEFAIANREQWGVWGGRDRNPKRNPKRETTVGSQERRSDRPTVQGDPEVGHNPGGRQHTKGRGEGAVMPWAERREITDRTTSRLDASLNLSVPVEVPR